MLGLKIGLHPGFESARLVALFKSRISSLGSPRPSLAAGTLHFTTWSYANLGKTDNQGQNHIVESTMLRLCGRDEKCGSEEAAKLCEVDLGIEEEEEAEGGENGTVTVIWAKMYW